MALNIDDFLTVQEAAEMLGVSRQTIYNRIKAGTAPAHVRLGDRLFFERADVERMRGILE